MQRIQEVPEMLAGAVQDAAARISEISRHERLSAAQITQLASESIEQVLLDRVNFYPAETLGPCRDLCFIWACRPENPTDRSKTLGFRDGLALLRLHATECQMTRDFVLITNEWVARDFNEWQDTLQRLRDEGRRVHFMLRTPGGSTWLNA